MVKKVSVKALVLSTVFVHCYQHQRELTVSELLAVSPILRAHYGVRPHVLSNMLRRYTKFGLLYRRKDVVRGCPYRYNLTEKGFNRLFWMFENPERYLYSGEDILEPLAPAFVTTLEKRIAELDKRRFDNFVRRLQESSTASQKKRRVIVIDT